MKNLICIFLLSFCLSSISYAADEPRTGFSVNINSASAELLAETLDGIGARKAQAIVEYRKLHGAFSSAAALSQVKGIGSATIAQNKKKIRLK